MIHSSFIGSPIAFYPPAALRAYKFEGNILDELPPEVTIARQEDVQRVQQQAAELVELAFRDRTQRAALSMPKVSDIVRVTRAEGLALGAGASGRLSPAAGVDLRGRFGFADKELKGEVGVGLKLPRSRGIRAFAMRDYVDVRDVPEVSGVRNSIASQEFGSDYTDPIDLRAVGVQFTLGRWLGARWRVDVAAEQHDQLNVRATPENGTYEPMIPARAVRGNRVSLRGEGALWSVGGGTLHANGELRLVDYDGAAARVSANAEFERAVGGGQLFTRTVAAALTGGALPPQLFVYFGGPTTAPGYAFDDFAARRGISQRVEYRREISFFPIPLGRFGQVPGKATIIPFAHAVWASDPARVAAINTPPEPTPSSFVRGSREGLYPAVGLGFEPLLGMIRLDLARGLRDGRWTFGVDLSRTFWPVF